jgi:ATP-dependent Clp protease ATP-binding subunit ClpA
LDYSVALEEVIKFSRTIAIDYKNSHISSYHFLLACLESENKVEAILRQKAVNFNDLTTLLKTQETAEHIERYYLTKELERAFKNAKYYSWVYSHNKVEVEDLLFYMLLDRKSLAGHYLNKQKLNYRDFTKEYKSLESIRVKTIFGSVGNNRLIPSIKLIKYINKYYLK